ncbi:N-acetylmannosamine kinase [Streptomyces glaucescens]
MRKTANAQLLRMGIDLRDVDQPIGTLSGGERQCVAIARAVYFGAKVLILDEPTAALGVKQSGVVLKYVAAARDEGLGVVFITHNPHHAYLVGQRLRWSCGAPWPATTAPGRHHPGRADGADGRRNRPGRSAPGTEPAAEGRGGTARTATAGRRTRQTTGTAPFRTPHPREAESATMSTYGTFSAPIGSRRAPALRTIGTLERRSHLTAPRVPTVGIDIGGTKAMAGVVDADGNILEKLRTETPDKSKSPKVVEDTIVELVLDLSDRHDVHAVGIGAAGWVDADRNRVLFAPHLSCNEPLRDRIADRLAVPVLVDNDANTAAWAEWRFGAGRGEDHLVMITLGTGIGGAILEDGQVEAGQVRGGPEFGHMQAVPGGHRCPCGNRGCWSSTAPGTRWSARPGSWPPPTPRWRTGSSSTSRGRSATSPAR